MRRGDERGPTRSGGARRPAAAFQGAPCPHGRLEAGEPKEDFAPAKSGRLRPVTHGDGVPPLPLKAVGHPAWGRACSPSRWRGRKATRSAFRSRGARPLALPTGKVSGLGRVLGVDVGVQPARWRVALATSSRRAAPWDGGRCLLRPSHAWRRAASRSLVSVRMAVTERRGGRCRPWHALRRYAVPVRNGAQVRHHRADRA